MTAGLFDYIGVLVVVSVLWALVYQFLGLVFKPTPYLALESILPDWAPLVAKHWVRGVHFVAGVVPSRS